MTYALYYGNDLERLLPYLETEDLPVARLGPESLNPQFTVPQPPVSERFPWLITLGVVLAALVVGALLFGVLRQAKNLLPPAS